MSDDLNTEIKIGADASGVEAGVGRAKRSLKDLGDAAQKAGKDAGAGMAAVGAGGDKAAKDVERATKNIQGQLQRAIASFEAGEKGSRKFYESIARQRGVDVNTLKPLLDQLDAYKAKSEAAAQASAKVGTSFTGLSTAAGLAARAMAAIGIGASVGEFVRMADASTNVASRLGLVTSSAAELASVQQRLFSIAQSSRVSFVDLVGTYAQVARSTKDLGVSQTALLGVIQTISQAVTISGGSAASAQAALTQLSQGFASGALRGEELNSILEQTPRLAQALADGLGVGIGQLREMGKAGELTSEKVLGALEKSAASVAAEFGKMAVTVEQASTNAANSALKLVGVLDKITGASSATAGGITRLSAGMDALTLNIERLSNSKGLGDFFFLAFNNERSLNGELAITQKELAQLEARLAKAPSNIYTRSAVVEMREYVKELKEAQARLAALSGQAGPADPRDQSGFTGRGASYANEAARQAKLRDDADAFRLNQAGVPASYLKDMAELIRLNQAGVIVGKEYTDALAKQQDLLLKKTTTVRGSAAAANAEQNAYESLISSIRAKIEADNLEIAGGAALTESQRIRIKLDQDLAAGRVKLSAQNERAVRLALEELAASEASALAAKTLAKANLDAAASREKYIASLATGLDKIQAEIAAQNEATERMGLSKEAIAELDAAKLEMLATDLELQAIKAMDRNLDQQTYDALKKQAEAYRELGIAKKGGAAKEAALEMEKANKDAAKKAQEDWERASEKINDTLTDALMRGFESGKDFAKNLRDTVVNMFKTMVLRPIISAVVNPVAGALTGALGFAGTASAATGAASGGSGIGSIVSAGSSIYSALTTGVSNSITSAFSKFAGSSVGQSLGLSNTAYAAGPMGPIAPGTELTAMGQSLGTGLGMAGSGLAGYGISSAISNGYTTGGNTVNVLSGIASAFFGPIAGVVGGLINRTFGRKLKDTGIEGTLGGEAGFEGRGYQFYKGGWLRSDKTKYSAIDPKLDSGLDAAVRQMQQSMLGLANSFDLPTEAITGFTQSVKLSFKGLDEAGIQAKIQEALTGYNEALANVVIESMENSEVPAWVDRLIGNTDASAVQRLQAVAEWPARMLQQFGTSRDAMVQQFAQGLASGDAMAAGQSVADTLVASIQNAVLTNAAGQIFDIVNQGIVTPMLDAIATGASVSEALSQATIDKTIERATEQAKALGALFGNAEFAAALEQLRTAVGGALGQAGGYLQALPHTLVATQQIDSAAQSAEQSAKDAAKAWEDINKALASDRLDADIALLRAMGQEEAALKKERERAIEGYDAQQIAMYDGTQAILGQVAALERQAEAADLARQKAEELAASIASELPAVLDKFRTPEQRTQAQYSSIAGDLVAAGLSGADVGSLASALESMSKDQIAAAAVEIYNMAGVTDDMRLALVRAASGLADLKDAAEAAAEAAQGIVDGSRGSLDNLIKSLTEGAAKATGGAIGRLSVTGAEYEQFRDFAQQLDGATQALKELEKLNLGDDLKHYADQIGAIVRETENLLADQLSRTRLLQGNAEGAMAALRAMSDLTHDQFATAGAYNQARAQEDARNARNLYAQASANALTTVNVAAVLGTLADVLNSEELWRPVAVEIASGIAQGNLLVRDAVADAAGVLARNGLPTIGGSGIAAVHAAQAKLASASAGGWARGSWQMGEDVVAYGQALDRLDGLFKSGKISAQEHASAVDSLNAVMGRAADLLGDTAAQAANLAAAQQAVGDAGLQSIAYYFDQYGQMADKLAETARQSATALGQTTDAIGRLNSASSVFGQSASAAASWEDYAGLSSVSKSRLVADSARTAAAAMTTADAERAAAALAKTGVFASAASRTLVNTPAFASVFTDAALMFDGVATSVRDAALMLDGVGQYDSRGFEDAFIRIGAALGRGQISEAQYKALFDTALELYKTGTTSAAEAARNLTSSFERLRDVMGDFADGLLIGDKTTLNAGQTLAEIQRQYTEALIGSANGDTDAMGKYTELANLLLDKDRYSTQAEYNAVFGRVYGDARELQAHGVNVLANQQNGVVTELKAMNASLNKRVEDLEKNLVAALAQIAKNTSDTNKGVARQTAIIEEQGA